VNVPDVVSFKESVKVTVNDTDGTPAGGVPVRNPAELSVSHDGNPEADHTYPPLPPDAVKLSL
jgi:hypothetical protein